MLSNVFEPKLVERTLLPLYDFLIMVPRVGDGDPSFPVHPSDSYGYFFLNFDKMVAGGHFKCPEITFDRISGHFRSIRHFYYFEKMATGGHLGWDDNVNYRTRPRYLDE